MGQLVGGSPAGAGGPLAGVSNTNLINTTSTIGVSIGTSTFVVPPSGAVLVQIICTTAAGVGGFIRYSLTGGSVGVAMADKVSSPNSAAVTYSGAWVHRGLVPGETLTFELAGRSTSTSQSFAIYPSSGLVWAVA